MSSLPIFANENIKINKVRGVYFLFDDDELVYIGQSENILSRIASHLNDKRFDSFNYIECRDGDLNAVEAEQIAKHLPKYNKALPKNGEWMSQGAIKEKFGVGKGRQKKAMEKEWVERVVINGTIYFKPTQVLGVVALL